jgi:hypothetical protein
MGRGKAKSFKPKGKDTSKIAKANASKKAKKSVQKTGIRRGRVESAKTERKVNQPVRPLTD